MNTGGGCMLDIFQMDDQWIGITSEVICLYEGTLDDNSDEEWKTVGFVDICNCGQDLIHDHMESQKGEGWFIQSWDKETDHDEHFFDVIRMKNGIIIEVRDHEIDVWSSEWTYQTRRLEKRIGVLKRG